MGYKRGRKLRLLPRPVFGFPFAVSAALVAREGVQRACARIMARHRMRLYKRSICVVSTCVDNSPPAGGSQI